MANIRWTRRGLAGLAAGRPRPRAAAASAAPRGVGSGSAGRRRRGRVVGAGRRPPRRLPALELGLGHRRPDQAGPALGTGDPAASRPPLIAHPLAARPSRSARPVSRQSIRRSRRPDRLRDRDRRPRRPDGPAAAEERPRRRAVRLGAGAEAVVVHQRHAPRVRLAELHRGRHRPSRRRAGRSRSRTSASICFETSVRSARVIRTPVIASGPASVNSWRNPLDRADQVLQGADPGQRRDARVDRDQDLADRVEDRHVQRRLHRAGVDDHDVVAGDRLEQPADPELAPLPQALACPPSGRSRRRGGRRGGSRPAPRRASAGPPRRAAGRRGACRPGPAPGARSGRSRAWRCPRGRRRSAAPAGRARPAPPPG